jgi:hypothetical protein
MILVQKAYGCSTSGALTTGALQKERKKKITSSIECHN